MEEEEDPFVLEDTCLLNTDNMDAQSYDTSSLASSDSGDPAHLKRQEHTHFENFVNLLPPVVNISIEATFRYGIFNIVIRITGMIPFSRIDCLAHR